MPNAAEAPAPKNNIDTTRSSGSKNLKYPIKHGEAKKTITLNDNTIVDFGQNDKLIGVEILNVSKVLAEKVLIQAKATYSLLESIRPAFI